MMTTLNEQRLSVLKKDRMITTIEHLWIIRSNGTCAVYRNCDDRNQQESLENIQGISSFMSAILSLSKCLNAGNFEAIKMSKTSIHYYACSNYIIAAHSSNKNKEKSVRRDLKKISNLLLETSGTSGVESARRDISGMHEFESKLDAFLGLKKE
ncbi:MAG: hypothetical protein ACFFD4_34225 [Candidatus Odinarchaeota archaeon]